MPIFTARQASQARRVDPRVVGQRHNIFNEATSDSTSLYTRPKRTAKEDGRWTKNAKGCNKKLTRKSNFVAHDEFIQYLATVKLGARSKAYTYLLQRDDSICQK